MSKPDNPPAFPSPMIPEWSEGANGMTLRDYFAGQVIPAVIAATSAGRHHPVRFGENTTLHQGMARDAYEMADAMLAERAKGENIDVRA